MGKFRLMRVENGRSPELIGEYDTLDDAAKKCVSSTNGEYNNAAYDAIICRGYYNCGYSSRQYYVDEA